ncbi:MAG: ROK family protein [Acidobacteria bacterium]|nr:ROK family protein [Acidobacteriota bacterium]
MSSASPVLLGGVEAGGTKFVCVVGTGIDGLRTECRIPTTTPAETLGEVVRFFADASRVHGPLGAIGVGSFGPVDLHASSPTFGCITATPKPGWSGADLVGTFGRELGVPVGFDTDVNAAALGEWRHGAARGLDSFVYLTVGTGIGGGGLAAGRLLHGLVHPEMGHLRVPHDHAADPFPGVCPFHGDCLEGLASGPAMAARWGTAAETLDAGHPAWALEARYLALALQNIVCTLSPERVVIGGGVMAQPALLPRVRRELATLLNGYVQAPEVLHHMDEYVVAPVLGDRAGVAGALVLAAAQLPPGLGGVAPFI